MNFNKYTLTKFEVDNQMFIYDNDMTSVHFSTIELELKSRIKNIVIYVKGEYDPKSNIDQYVYLHAFYDGYHYRIMLEKEMFIRDGVQRYYDFLASQIINVFALYLFSNRGEINDN